MGRTALPTGVLRQTRRARLPVRLIAGLALAAVVLGGGYLWLRGSSLVRVDQVDVLGVSSSQGGEVTAALERSAKTMTTLHWSEPELRAAVADYSSVAAIHVKTAFPHDMTIEVTERQPVAVAEVGGQSVAIGAGGRVMRDVRVGGALPAVPVGALSDGGRLTDPKALRAVAVLAAAPAALRETVARASWARKGLTLELRDGPLLIFGDAARPRAKWAAAGRVLADASSAGAVYLDVRVPERVAAGGLGGVASDDDLSLDPTGTGQSLDPQVQAEESPSLTP